MTQSDQSRDFLYEFGGFHLDPARRFLVGPNGDRIALKPKVFDTLVVLVTHPRQVLDKTTLMEAVWGDAVVEENSLNQHISTLRRTLGETPGENRFIVTVPGRGYSFVADVISRPRESSLKGSQTVQYAGDHSWTNRHLTRLPQWPGYVTVAVVGLLAVVIAAVFAVNENSLTLPGRSVDTLVIVPFDYTGDQSMEYLSEGMSRSLLMRLSRIDDLRIKWIARDALAGSSLRRLGGHVDTDAVSKGSIADREGALQVEVELINADNGSIIWRDAYSTQMSSLSGILGEMSIGIASRLGVDIGDNERAALTRHSTANPAAHRLYLQGRYFWNRRTREGFAASIDSYNRAIALDPNYALAYAGLAHTQLMKLGWSMQQPSELAPLVEKAAQQAIQRDPSLAEPHAALGYLRTMYDRDWKNARNHFLRAIALNSNYSSAHHWYAFLLLTEGRRQAAIEEILLARELEPLSPIINAEVGYFFLFDRQYERALEELKGASLLDPNYPSTVRSLVRAYAMLGRREEALAAVDRWRNAAGDSLITLGIGATSLPLIGLEEEARRIYERLLLRSQETYVMPGLLGMLSASLGEYDAAFKHFNQSLEEGSLIVSWLRDPILDDLRDDSRFDALFERVDLEL